MKKLSIKFNKHLPVSGRYSCRTDIGKVRLTNEDQASATVNAKGDVFLIVCDGMGGQNKGELASSIAVSHLIDDFNSSKFLNLMDVQFWLNRHIRAVNRYIYNEARQNALYRGMGTTLTAVIIYKGSVVTAQIGDSRLYEIQNNNLVQLTSDQTYVNYLYNTGQITKEEMATHPRRHMLMNALGTYPSVEIDISTRPYVNQTLLLCSDGLYNNVSETTIASILKGKDSPEEKVNELISIANNNGGSDNIGIVIWEATYVG